MFSVCIRRLSRLNSLSFVELLNLYGEAWDQLHKWGRIIRSSRFIDAVRIMHAILMGNIEGHMVDLHYIIVEMEKSFNLTEGVEEIVTLLVKEGFVKRTGRTYELTLYGRLFLFVISDALVEIATFYRTLPTQREVRHILRVLSMLRAYESEGLVTENPNLLIAALSNIRKRLLFIVDSDDENLYSEIVARYELIKNALLDNSLKQHVLQALTTVIDTEIGFIREHIGEIKRLKKQSEILLYRSTREIERLKNLDVDEIEKKFRFHIIPFPTRISPVSYIVRYSDRKKEKEESFMIKFQEQEDRIKVPFIPSADEIFHVLWNYYVEYDELPNMEEDNWWLDKLDVYQEEYWIHKDEIGYIKAIKARKVMALSMFLTTAITDKSMSISVRRKGENYFKQAYMQALQ